MVKPIARNQRDERKGQGHVPDGELAKEAAGQGNLGNSLVNLENGSVSRGLETKGYVTVDLPSPVSHLPLTHSGL